MHIVQVANFYSETSGGLRTTIDALRRGYLAAGHDVTLVVPGEIDADVDDGIGRRITIRGPRVPGGYRVIARPDALRAVLRTIHPDRLEVSDKMLVLPAARVASKLGVPVVLVSHERLDGILANRVPSQRLLRGGADRWNAHLGELVETVVCASDYAAEEFERVGVAVTRVPLGVDLDVFHPSVREPRAGGDPVVLYAGRLSAEKRPEVVLSVARLLACRGHRVRAVYAGTGPLATRLEGRAGHVAVEFLGHVRDRAELARVIASADVVLAPCPVETFGLGVLESLACGTPVVVPAAGAAQELVTPWVGRVARDTTGGFAEAVAGVIAAGEGMRRAARAHALAYPWSATVRRMLAVHRVEHRRAA